MNRYIKALYLGGGFSVFILGQLHSGPLSLIHEARASDTSPAGMVGFFTDTQCPDGWTEAAYAQGRLSVVVTDLSTYTQGKQVGTALKDQTAPQHTHTFKTSISLPEKKMTWGACGGGNKNGAQKGSYDVPESPPGTTAAAGELSIPLFQLLACEKSAVSPPPAADDYPMATLALFNSKTCPSNWQPAQATVNGYYKATWQGDNNYSVEIWFTGKDADGDGYLRGRGSQPSSISGGYSNELSDWTMQVLHNGQLIVTFNWAQQQQRTDFNVNYSITNNQVIASNTWSTAQGFNAGFHVGSIAPLYNLTSQDNTIILDLSSNYLATTSWGNKQFSAGTTTSLPVNGFFVMPFYEPPNGTVGQLVGQPLNNAEQRTHHHPFSSSITLTEMKYESAIAPVTCSSLTSDGTHDFKGTTGDSPNNVPYVQLLLCERQFNASSNNPPVDIPTGIVTYFGEQTCGYGWKPSATGSGRFIVGLPDGGTPNQAFGGNAMKTPGDRISHTHAFSGNVNIPYHSVALADGSNNTGYGLRGTYSFNGTTGAADLGVPYLVTANCQPCVQGDSDPACQQQVQQ